MTEGSQGWICANSVLFHTRFLHNIFTGKYIHVRVVLMLHCQKTVVD